MFYFFQRQSDFVRCEVTGDGRRGYRITITQPDGTERTETFDTSDETHARWLEIQEELRTDGWWGPHGRD